MRPAGVSTLSAVALLAALMIAGPAAAAQISDRDLVGTWHVLVHYKDANAYNKDVWRWDDRVWEFKKEGSRLRWIEYPIVVFSDQSGRFEMAGTNRMSRVLHAWEPNVGQQAQIREGLEVNPRGKKSKTLRGSDDKGWASQTRATAASASVITYVENWSIDGMPAAPVFQRADILGSARTENLDGITRYTTLEISEDGGILRGEFVRDGTRIGTFRLTRSGKSMGVKGSGKTQSQRLMDAWFGEFSDSIQGGNAMRAEILRKVQSGEIEATPEIRAEVRKELRREIEQSIRKKGLDPDDYAVQVEALSEQIQLQIIDEGRSVEEIGRMLEKGELGP
jgi:hypothetical protein